MAQSTPSSPVEPGRVGVLLAGGVGLRLGHDRPKQLLELRGRSILEHSLRALHDHPGLDEVLVVMAPGHLEAARDLAAGFGRVSDVIAGGQTRTASTLAALAHLGARECHVLFHDAARPLVSARIVSDCLAALESHAAVATAVPSTDTVFEVGADDTIAGVPPRVTLRRAQTPQGFHASVLRQAYVLAAEDPDFVATDDCSVVHRYLPGVPIRVVEGEERNLKITTALDLVLADALLRGEE